MPAPGSASSGCVNMSVNNSVLAGMGMGVILSNWRQGLPELLELPEHLLL